MPDLQRQYRDIDQKAGEIGTVQVILQPIDLKSDRLLAFAIEYLSIIYLKTNNTMEQLLAYYERELVFLRCADWCGAQAPRWG